jgi:hypothetical protein
VYSAILVSTIMPYNVVPICFDQVYMASQRQRNKWAWVQKTSRTGYFGEEKWEGGGPPYKPIYIYIFHYPSHHV